MNKNAWKKSVNLANNYFTKKPLNYETYVKRLKAFKKLAVKPTNNLLKDCIKAGRLLQLENTLYNQNIRVNNSLLDINLVKSNSEIESKLWKFLWQYKSLVVNNNAVVRSYIYTEPRPTNISNQFKLVVGNFKNSLKTSNITQSPVKLFFGVLLNNKDYYNCFKLIDLTYSSPEYLSFKKQKLYRDVSILGSVAVVVSGLECYWMPLLPCLFWVLLNLGISCTFLWGYIKLYLTPHLGRVSWRPYNTILRNYQHQEEIITINKIITHFEEHNEVNIKNYHHSEVRNIGSLNVFESNDYILELPNSTQIGYADESENDRETIRLWKFFRAQLQNRRVVLNDLAEELMFLEFWLTHGEKFIWVEPDQDPAEILNLKIAHSDH